MPYIVTTYDTSLDLNEQPSLSEVASRRAVATLDEAREAVDAVAMAVSDTTGIYDSTPEELPETGGTVDPLPDGTVIEVEQVSYPLLASRLSLFGEHLPSDAEIIAAYNEAQAVSA